MALPILPPAPSRTDTANFSAEADAWVAALPAWTDAVNAIEGSLQASTLVGTSTTSLSVGTGAKGFTSQAGKAWLVGSYVFIVATADNSKIMQGKITTYNSSTGSLVVDVNIASGTGTYVSWNIGVANPAIGYNNSVNVVGDILVSGNIGVNCTPNTWHASARAIQMGSAGAIWNYSSTQMNMTQGLHLDATDYRYLNTGVPVSLISLNNGEVYFNRATSGTAGSVCSTMPTSMLIDTSGNVVIGGQTVPGGSPRFHVAGSGDQEVQFTHSDNVPGRKVTLRLTNNNSSYYQHGPYIQAVMGPGLNNYSSMNFGINTAQAMCIDGAGNTLIGLSSSTGTYKLEVAGNIRASAYYMNTTGNGSLWNTLAGNILFGTTNLERMRIDSAGNVLVTGSGGLGYGTGSGGTVTQITSKSTPVTLNKPTGRIIVSTASLAANTTVFFTFNNTSIGLDDVVTLCIRGGQATSGTYNAWVDGVAAGQAVIALRNLSASALGEGINLSFAVIKSSTT